MLSKAVLLLIGAICSPSLSARPYLAGWDDSVIGASHSGGMHFAQTPGNLEVSDYGFHVVLPEAIPLTECLTLQPALDFSTKVLRFNQVPTSVPVDRNNLETFSVYPSVLETSALLAAARGDSPWMFGAWTKTGVATDFRGDINGDDVTLDLTGGLAYRYDGGVSIGIGAAFTDIGNDFHFYPGLGIDWRISERFRIAVCGATTSAIYQPDGNWRLSVEGRSNGEIWNISDDERKSRYIDFRSYQVGLFASRRLFGEVLIHAGAGVTLGNEIALNQSNGHVLLKQRLDSGFFSSIGLMLASW